MMAMAAAARLWAFVATIAVPMAGEGAGSLDLPGAVSQGLEIVGSVFTFMFGNPVCLVLIGLGLIPLGFKIFKSMKRAAK